MRPEAIALVWALANIGAVLLVVAGVFKIARPAETAEALRVVGLPPSKALVRVLGTTELVLGSTVILFPSVVTLAALGVAYVGFAGFALLSMRSRTPLRSCGCFGRFDTPPSPLHVGFDALIAVAAAGVARAPMTVRSIGAWMGVLVGSYLLFGILTALPTAMREGRR